jgi:DNA-binding GntR family transcriptional regulator
MQHHQILDALREEQADLARRLMADHIDRTKRLLNGLLGCLAQYLKLLTNNDTGLI